ncbi:unnamed protein product [Pylaiella littoralis]
MDSFWREGGDGWRCSAFFHRLDFSLFASCVSLDCVMFRFAYYCCRVYQEKEITPINAVHIGFVYFHGHSLYRLQSAGMLMAFFATGASTTITMGIESPRHGEEAVA